jgi:hypothetical protein
MFIALADENAGMLRAMGVENVGVEDRRLSQSCGAILKPWVKIEGGNMKRERAADSGPASSLPGSPPFLQPLADPLPGRC